MLKDMIYAKVRTSFRPLRGLRISQSVSLNVNPTVKLCFRPLRGLRISQYKIAEEANKHVNVSVPYGVFVFLNCLIA